MKRSICSYKVSDKARAIYAERIFDIATVTAAISKRAAEGYRHYRIEQLHPFDLSETEAALQLVHWLEYENFRYNWHHTPEVIDPHRPMETGEHPELVVYW